MPKPQTWIATEHGAFSREPWLFWPLLRPVEVSGHLHESAIQNRERTSAPFSYCSAIAAWQPRRAISGSLPATCVPPPARSTCLLLQRSLSGSPPCPKPCECGGGSWRHLPRVRSPSRFPGRYVSQRGLASRLPRARARCDTAFPIPLVEKIFPFLYKGKPPTTWRAKGRRAIVKRARPETEVGRNAGPWTAFPSSSRFLVEPSQA